MQTSTASIQTFRVLMLVVIAGLVLSGVTAFPLLYELELLATTIGSPPETSTHPWHGLQAWIQQVRDGLRDTYPQYPWIAYGTDWLAFGHLVIALFFVGPVIWPRRDHRATLIAGLIACVGVIPLAFIAGEIRGIPWGWRLIDCAFGVFGFIPLWWALMIHRRVVGHDISMGDADVNTHL